LAVKGGEDCAASKKKERRGGSGILWRGRGGRESVDQGEARNGDRWRNMKSVFGETEGKEGGGAKSPQRRKFLFADNMDSHKGTSELGIYARRAKREDVSSLLAGSAAPGKKKGGGSR